MDLRPFLNEHVVVQLRGGLMLCQVTPKKTVTAIVMRPPPGGEGPAPEPQPLVVPFLVGKVIERKMAEGSVLAVRYSDPSSTSENIEVVLAPEMIAAVSLAGEANRLTIVGG